jgi:hypothetical protein
MHRNMIRTLVVIGLVLAAGSAAGKGRTVRILITGTDFAESLEITDPDVVGRFFVYTGPGVRINGQQVHTKPEGQIGAFIDWPKGRVRHRPSGLRRVEVGFYCEGTGNWLCYKATYEYDPACTEGYMYLPGREDDSYRGNVSTIVHGVEGNWFHSSPAWERLVRPRIEQARREPAAPRTRFITPI